MRKAPRVVVIAVAVIFGIVVLAIAPFLLFTPRAPKPAGQPDTVDRLEAYFRALTLHETPPALDIVVMKNGAVVYSKAFGVTDSRTKTPAAPDGVYHYWSVTKLFTATAIMQLVEDGKLGLDDPVSMYLPAFTTVTKSGEAADITVRQLLAHTSGMKDLAPTALVGWIHHLDENPVSQTSIVLERMQEYRRLATEPGKIGAYSNAGYIVLGAIVEAAARMPYEDVVRSRILRPLGMKSTDFLYRDDLLPHAVAGTHPLFHFFTPLLLMLHRDWFSKWVGKISNQRMWLVPIYTDYTAPTGLLGTAGDLARFGQAFLSAGKLDGNRILKTETVAAMLDTGFGGMTGPDKDRTGLGWHWWNEAPIPFKGHGGGGPGFGTQLAIFPTQEMVVVVLANDTLIDRIGLTNLVAAAFQ